MVYAGDANGTRGENVAQSAAGATSGDDPAQFGAAGTAASQSSPRQELGPTPANVFHSAVYGRTIPHSLERSMPKSFRALLAFVAVLAIAAPAAAANSSSATLAPAPVATEPTPEPTPTETTPPPFVPDLRTERTYLACNGANKVQNNEGQVAWNTTKPATSYTAGGGCGSADPGLLINTADDGGADLVATGTYTGNLDKISVHLHTIDGPYSRSGVFPVTVGTQVEVDGVIVFESGADGIELDAVRSSTGATALAEYTITNLNRLASTDLKEHEVIVRVATHFSDDANAWVWGASEIDSGVTFNPTAISGVKVKATG